MLKTEKRTNYDRKVYLGFFVFFVSICIAIVTFFHSVPFVRGFMGDMIVVMLMYSFCKSVFDFPPLSLAFAVLTVSFSVEIAQYLRSIGIVRWNETEISRLTVGAVFDPWDLIAYLFGVTAIYSLDRSILKRIQTKNDPSYSPKSK
ncbi:DUF2809 domain-containing protein [Leptospira gomenensis]|uniref:DUF2809 domain-containing protein n=1 Tax=Leptospira gomenensis TaxID=2484974 RepID=A0A5F1YD66_9LEPT|nr:DUF2809 domain-containing protein [Leptospira gomenensis]TGK36005.1 DUF2809 domain-containing protein [Leptospira gomenensis]TGK39963.1 DUF2809 domain-containing protein [Leptospira gomenensis]TGK51413.1 DUF2809 domain-containing protein [Leptospira gomenensis]TGK64912.1 DUF2809 domain-containing protein [Leptospira gomenensis]